MDTSVLSYVTAFVLFNLNLRMLKSGPILDLTEYNVIPVSFLWI